MNDPGTKEDRLTLELLDAIERRSDLSQRHLARQMGVALGLANSYLRRCAKKGLVKIREAPANRYLYYLTPKGFAEKARLTARFLSTSLTFYRQSAEAVSDLYQICQAKRWHRVVLCGASDLAEIAVMRAIENGIDITGVFAPGATYSRFVGRPVWSTWEMVPPADAYLITDLTDPVTTYGHVRESVTDESRVLVPSVLGINGAVDARGDDNIET